MNDHLIHEEEDFDRAAYSIKAMAHPLRLKILCHLGEGRSSVLEIVSACGTSQSNIFQHLGLLRDKGILGCKKEANKVFYFIQDARTMKLISLMREVFCNHSSLNHKDPE